MRLGVLRRSGPVIWECAPARQPGRIPARRHGRRRPAAARGRRCRRWRRRSARRRPAPAGGRRPRPCRSAGTRKAPCTLSARSVLRQPDLLRRGAHALERAMRTGTPLACEIAPASAADWLKRRAHSRRQCSGTGTSASASASSSRPARAIQRPIIGARSSRSPYLKRMHQRAGDVVVAHRGAGAVIGRRIGDRLHRQQAGAGIVGERNAEPRAIGRLDEATVSTSRRRTGRRRRRAARGRTGRAAAARRRAPAAARRASRREGARAARAPVVRRLPTTSSFMLQR